MQSETTKTTATDQDSRKAKQNNQRGDGARQPRDQGGFPLRGSPPVLFLSGPVRAALSAVAATAVPKVYFYGRVVFPVIIFGSLVTFKSDH